MPGKQTISGDDTVYAALVTKCVSNFTELYNYINGTTAPTLLTPTIASFANATHTHANDAGGGATLTCEAWTEVSSFGAGWTGSTTVGYMKDLMGFVHLRGSFSTTGASTAAAFTLPAGYRPAQIQYWPVIISTTAIALKIATNGEITNTSGTSGSIPTYLDGITFKAA